MPYDLQRRLGESVAEDLIGEQPLCPGRAGLAAINGLANAPGQGRRLSASGQVEIVKGGPVNAFTLPGGILVFYSDLIDLARDGNEVAGVLAHEMGHVMHYHAIKGLARQFGIDQLLKSMTGGFSDLGTVGQAAACCWRCATAAASSATPTPPASSCCRSSACAPTASPASSSGCWRTSRTTRRR